MKLLELGFFGLCALLVVLGGLFTVAARNPIRSAMGLLTAIVGTAGMYLMLSAEFLAAIQILVYAGAVVVLFLFVIMLLGPSAMSARDARSAIPRYIGAGVFLVASLGALIMALGASAGPTALPEAPATFGSIDALGRELFTAGIVPFELSGALLLIAVVGAVAVARGKQIDPTLHSAKAGAAVSPSSSGVATIGSVGGEAPSSAPALPAAALPAKEQHS